MEFLVAGPGLFKDVDPAKGIFTGYASTFGVADAKEPPDVVEPGAFSKSIQEWGPNGKRRIKCLFMHEPLLLVGRPLVLREDATGLYHETKVANTSTGRDVLQLIAEGVLTEHSIGYDPIKADYDAQGRRHLREVRLWEYSVVTWGMNEVTPVLEVKGSPGYRRLSERMAKLERLLRTGRFETDEVPHLLELALHRYAEEVKAMEQQVEEQVEQWPRPITVQGPGEEKGATRFADLPLADRGRAWNSDAAVKRVRDWAGGEQNMDWAKYRRAFFWYDASAPDNFTSYKLPFADVIDGELRAVPRAIFAAAAAIQGARGGVDIPEADVAAVQAHIARYYEKMRREFEDDSIIPPWEKGQKILAAALEIKAQDLASLVETISKERQRRRVMDRFWELQDALWTVVRSLVEDQEASQDEKLAVLDSSLQQFHDLMLAAFVALLSLEDAQQAVAEAASARGPREAKEGRVLSKANRELLLRAIEALQAVLAAAEKEPADPATPEGEQKSRPEPHAGEPDDEIHSLERFVQGLAAERKAREEAEIAREIERILAKVRSDNHA